MITSTDRTRWQDKAHDAERFLAATDELIRQRLDDAGLLGSGRRARHDGPEVSPDEDDGFLRALLPRPVPQASGWDAAAIYDDWLMALAIMVRTVKEERETLPK